MFFLLPSRLTKQGLQHLECADLGLLLLGLECKLDLLEQGLDCRRAELHWLDRQEYPRLETTEPLPVLKGIAMNY